MSVIKVLDPQTVDQIAAGEVVERPESVVKELVENAMDAGADSISVEIKDGGISLIRVTDNGCGIEKEQVRTAFLRHATSKIADASDLNEIRSYGFRGEALSSISAVARGEMITKTKNEISGVRMTLEGSEEGELEEIGAPDGTTVVVRNLFFNVPVRKKFLKSPQTEGSYISDLMEHLALSHPSIAFRFMNGNQLKFATSGSGDLKEVIYKIYGKETWDEIIPMDANGNGIHLYGYLGKPSRNRSNRNGEIYYVNSRYIRSKVLFRAIEDGYHLYLMQHKYPFCILMLDVDPSVVDVNVHPTKMDVRFEEPSEIYDFVSQSIARRLKENDMMPPVYLTEQEKSSPDPASAPEPFQRAAAAKVREQESRIVMHAVSTAENTVSAARTAEELIIETAANPAENKFTYEENEKVATISAVNEQKVSYGGLSTFFDDDEDEESAKPGGVSAAGSLQPAKVSVTTDLQEELSIGQEGREQQVPPEPEIRIASAVQMEIPMPEKILTENSRPKFRVLGQLFETYWLFEFEDKLLVMDQHAAHEKVNFEKFMKRYEAGEILSQSILPPQIVTLTGREMEVYRKYKNKFAEMGFETEEFGGKEISVHGAPMDLYSGSIRDLFLEMLDNLEDTGYGRSMSIESRIATMACKASVKGNMSMTREEVESLIDQLLVCDNPYFCPHGRPTMISFSKYEIDKKFKRIV